jgi:hypothetical protein
VLCSKPWFEVRDLAWNGLSGSKFEVSLGPLEAVSLRVAEKVDLVQRWRFNQNMHMRSREALYGG